MSDEIKSIKALNPVRATEEAPVNESVEVEEIVGTATTEVIDSTPEVVEEVTEFVELEDGIHHEDLDYVAPDEDTSLGTKGAFDFGRSINRRRQLVTEKIEAKKAEIEDEDLEKEIAEDSDPADDIDAEFGDTDNDEFADDETDVPAFTQPVKQPVQNKIARAAVSETPIKTEPIRLDPVDQLPSQNELFMDDKDFDDLDMDDMPSEEEELLGEKELEALKTSITDKLRSTEEAFDISGFTIAKTAISVNTALEYDQSSEKVFDWPLMSAGKLVSMRQFSGTEIDNLNGGGNSRNRFNNLKDIYHELYNHISDPKKPEFEPWLKITSFMDIPHLYMAAYKSSFNGANYIPFTCTSDKCNHIFLSDDIEIDQNMVKFKDEAAKLKFNEIMENSSTPNNKLYETRIIPVSKNYAIGFREPSIYNTIFENAVLDQKFVEKYKKSLSLMVYIDAIYLIKDGQLVPISLKVDRNNMAKTTKYKISTYAKIIAKLPSDGYQKVISVISSINELGDEVVYQLPEVTCTKCGHVIPVETKESSELLFSRHQLALIANS